MALRVIRAGILIALFDARLYLTRVNTIGTDFMGWYPPCSTTGQTARRTSRAAHHRRCNICSAGF